MPQEKYKEKCSRFQKRKRMYQVGDITKGFIYSFNKKYILGAYYMQGIKLANKNKR